MTPLWRVKALRALRNMIAEISPTRISVQCDVTGGVLGTASCRGALPSADRVLLMRDLHNSYTTIAFFAEGRAPAKPRHCSPHSADDRVVGWAVAVASDDDVRGSCELRMRGVHARVVDAGRVT